MQVQIKEIHIEIVLIYLTFSSSATVTDHFQVNKVICIISFSGLTGFPSWSDE